MEYFLAIVVLGVVGILAAGVLKLVLMLIGQLRKKLRERHPIQAAAAGAGTQNCVTSTASPHPISQREAPEHPVTATTASVKSEQDETGKTEGVGN